MTDCQQTKMLHHYAEDISWYVFLVISHLVLEEDQRDLDQHLQSKEDNQAGLETLGWEEYRLSWSIKLSNIQIKYSMP